MSSLVPHIVEIPNEILADIFRLALGNRSCRCDTRTIIQLVCRRWRRVMLDSKFLWSKIVLKVLDVADEMPPWCDDALSEFSGPDISYITQCLMIAHGYPLDIIISVRVTADYDEATFSCIREALELLHLHSIRWRSLSCSAPWWFFDEGRVIDKFLDRNDLPSLEKLSISVNAELDESLPLLAHARIALPASLRHLNLNFPFPRFDVAWSSLTSFVGGFDYSTEFFDVLPRMVALHTLHLTHLPLLGMVAPSQSITLNALRRLKLSQCAVCTLSSVVDNVRFPEVKELSLRMTEPHLHHMAQTCSREIVSADMADPLCCILEYSGASIGVLDINMDLSTPSAFVVQLCTKLNATVHSMRVRFSSLYEQQEIAAFLDLLTVRPNVKPLFPRLLELELVGVNQSFGFERLFKGPALEMLVVSRWSGGDGASTRLQTLRLRRARFQHNVIMDDEYEYSSDSLAKSSLAVTLHKLRSEGLNVQWLDEFLDESYYDSIPADVDVLDDTQQYIPMTI